VDETHGTGLTGSQWTAVVVMALCAFALLVLRDTPWRSGRGELASVPRRYRTEAEPGPEAEPEAAEPVALDQSTVVATDERDDEPPP
jgi:hypothetical protein